MYSRLYELLRDNDTYHGRHVKDMLSAMIADPWCRMPDYQTARFVLTRIADYGVMGELTEAIELLRGC